MLSPPPTRFVRLYKEERQTHNQQMRVPIQDRECRTSYRMIPMDERSSPASSDEVLRAAELSDADTGMCSRDATSGLDGISLRRNLHSEKSKQLLLTWLEDNLDHPYPIEDKKLEFIRETGLTMRQINYWFINARRRKVPGMREQQRYRQAFTTRSHQLDDGSFHLRRDHMEQAERQFIPPHPATVYQGACRPVDLPQTTTLPSPTGQCLQQFSPPMATVACLPVRSPLQFSQQQPHQQAQQYQFQHQQMNPIQQQRPLQQQQATVWSHQGAVSTITPTGAMDWGHLPQGQSTASNSPPRTLSFEPTSSAGSLSSPQHSLQAFTAPSEVAAPVSPMTVQTGGSDANRGAVALSLGMPVIVQALRPIQQAPPPQTPVPMAVQASTYMPWSVVTPQVTLATSYPTNQVVYTPMTTVPSTLP